MRRDVTSRQQHIKQAPDRLRPGVTVLLGNPCVEPSDLFGSQRKMD
jgi:hypothetical protein